MDLVTTVYGTTNKFPADERFGLSLMPDHLAAALKQAGEVGRMLTVLLRRLRSP